MLNRNSLNKWFFLTALILGFLTSSQAASISMDVDNPNAQPGEEIRYTISLDYDGSNGLLSNTEVNDTVPAGTTYVGGSVSPAAAQYPADGTTGETVIWRLGSNKAGVIGTASSGGGSGTLDTNVPTKDTYIDEDKPTEHYENEEELYVYYKSSDAKDQHALLEWSISSIPAGATITSATIQLGTTSSNNKAVDIYRITGSWEEDEVTWNNPVTYDTSKKGTISDPGGTSTSTSIIGLVEDAISSGASNFGVILIQPNNNKDFKFYSSDKSGEFHPTLHVAYTESGGADTSTEIIPSSLLKTTDGTQTIDVVMEINSTESDIGVTPSAMTIEGFDGADANCSDAPAAQNIAAGGSIQFTYTCTLTAGSGQGTVKFSADAAGGTYSYPTGTSATVIVVPPLTFVVKADDPASADSADNSAWISSYRPSGTDECYAVSDEDDRIYRLDLNSATSTALTSGTGVANIEALKFNLDYTTLYAINAGQLGTIDQTTGVFSATDDPIGTVNGSNVTDADSMSFDPINGDLYAAVRLTDNDLLIKLDPATGAHIPNAFNGGTADYLEISSGIAGIDDIDGMSFYPDGTLYAIMNNGGASDYLVIIDKTDGTVTNVGRVEDENGDPINDLESLSFMPDGTLYTTKGAVEPNGVLYSIDRTNAKMLSKGSIADGGDYEGLSCIESDSDTSEVIIEEQDAIISTLPVTIAYIHPELYGETLEIDFSTATETSNIGFNIYAIKGRKWIKLNDDLIPGALDSLVPQDYHASVEIPEDMKIRKIGIAGVDVDGVEDRHGPFKIGKESGSKVKVVPVDWKKVRKQVKKDRQVRKAKRVAKRVAKRKARKASKKVTRETLKAEIVNLDVKENAVYKVTHDELIAEGIDLKGFKAKRIAISFKGEGVARYIEGLNRRGKWTKKSYLEFKGEKPQGKDALYLKANNYRLSLNKKLAVESEAIEPVTRKELVFESNKRYALSIAGDDPFYDAFFYTMSKGQTKSLTRTFELSEVPQGNVEVTAHLSALSQSTHQVQISLNGNIVAQRQTEGWMDLPIRFDGSALQEGSNELKITTVNNSGSYGGYTYDKLVVKYDAQAQEPQSATLSLGDKIEKRSIKPKRGTDYLIISHPMFMGETLDHYIAQKESEGWKIHLVNVEDIYNAYGYGMVTPYAIKAYLKDAKQKGVTHVQLVGAANYDYHDYLGLGSVSFIGSIYVHSGMTTNYTPCDACLVADEAGIPQMAIGRWPVRTVEGFEAVVNKTLAWKDSGQSQAHSALFIADKKDKNNIEFGKQMDVLAGQFEATGSWSDITRVYLDTYIANENEDKAAAVTIAKETIVRSLNDGVSIISYSGHSSLSTWSYEGLLKQDDITLISNIDRTTIALPLACYTNYADSPRINTMAHQFLAKGENGFVAVYGAATLSNFRQNGVSASKVIDYLLKGETIGEAVRKTKRDLGTKYIDVIRNSNLLGDVTLQLK